MGKVVVVGSSNTDMVFRAPKMPLPGETLMGSEFAVIPGGKGANQAVAAARAGAEVVFIAKVGADDLGKQAIAGYEKDHINTAQIFIDPENPSGVAMILVDTVTGANSIVVAPGANGKLSVEDIQSAAREIKSADILLVQLEVPLETVHAALKIAKAEGVTTILNPAPAQPLSKMLLRLVDIITPNETETHELIGINPLEDQDIRKAATQLLDKVNDTAIITLGERGVFFISKNGETGFSPTSKVDVVDSTAAGDVFNGYLAAALAEGSSFLEAIQLANKAATISVTRKGAQPSIPYRKDC